MAEFLKKKYWRLVKYWKTSAEMNSREIFLQEQELIFTHYRDEFLINLGMFGLNFCKNKNYQLRFKFKPKAGQFSMEVCLEPRQKMTGGFYVKREL